MWELYRRFKAIGQLEYFFANIRSDPGTLIS